LYGKLGARVGDGIPLNLKCFFIPFGPIPFGPVNHYQKLCGRVTGPAETSSAVC